MGYRVKTRDVTVEVDTEEELSVALRVLGALEEKPTALFPPGKTLAPSSPKPIVFSMEQKMARLYKDIRMEPRGGMMEVIKILASTSEWISSEELKDSLTTKGSGLGGTLGAISKKAIKFGLQKEDVILREKTLEGIRFRLTPAMIEVVKSESDNELSQRIPKPIFQQKEGAEDI